MKAKSFLRNLSHCLYEEFQEDIALDNLRSSFVQAVKNLPDGKLKTDLNAGFEKYLQRLQKYLHALGKKELPPIEDGLNDSLEELAQSEPGNRTEIVAENPSKQDMHYNLMGKSVKKPKKKEMLKLDEKQRYQAYLMYLKEVMGRRDVTDALINKVVEDFQAQCTVTQDTEHGKKQPDWLPVCNVLLELTTGSQPIAFVRVLRFLFDSVGKDVNSCLSKKKVVRAGRLLSILKRFIISCHLGVHSKDKPVSPVYSKYMSALLSFYVDLCSVYSSKIPTKKKYGREVAGFVGYILQPWPESMIEVVLALTELREEVFPVLLPLIRKCFELKPPRAEHSHYLKYMLMARHVGKVYGDQQEVQQLILVTKVIPAGKGFIDWLKGECPDALEYIPHEDKKFRREAVTRFLLDEAEEDLIFLLLDNLCAAATEDEMQQTQEAVGTMATEELFYLDTSGVAADQDLNEAESAEEVGNTLGKKTNRKPIVLKTMEEIERLVDSEAIEDGLASPQTYKLDPMLISEKVKDPEDRRFLQSEIVSISSLSYIGENTRLMAKGNHDKKETKYAKGKAKGKKFDTSTPNDVVHEKSKMGNKKDVNIALGKVLSETEETEISETVDIDEFENTVDTSSVSASENDHKVKSVVTKVTSGNPRAENYEEKAINYTDEAESAIIVSDSDSDRGTERESTLEVKSAKAVNSSHREEVNSMHESSTEMIDFMLDSALNSNSSAISDLDMKAVREEVPEHKSQIRKSPRKRSLTRLSQLDKSPRTSSANNSVSEAETVETDVNKETSTRKLVPSVASSRGFSVSDHDLFSDESAGTTVTQDETEDKSVDETIRFVGKTDSEVNENSSHSSASDLESKNKHKSKLKHSETNRSKANTPTSPVKSPVKTVEMQTNDTEKIEAVDKSQKPANVSEVHGSESESEVDVFEKTSKKAATDQKVRKASIEDRFIGKAVKGKKTPKKVVKLQQNSEDDHQKSGMETSETEEIDTRLKTKSRSKSNEELMEIVDDITKKINEPLKNRKSLSDKCQQNESMFTDESVESAGTHSVSESEVSPQKQKRDHSKSHRKQSISPGMEEQKHKKGMGETGNKTPSKKSSDKETDNEIQSNKQTLRKGSRVSDVEYEESEIKKDKTPSQRKSKKRKSSKDSLKNTPRNMANSSEEEGKMENVHSNLRSNTSSPDMKEESALDSSKRTPKKLSSDDEEQAEPEEGETESMYHAVKKDETWTKEEDGLGKTFKNRLRKTPQKSGNEERTIEKDETVVIEHENKECEIPEQQQRRQRKTTGELVETSKTLNFEDAEATNTEDRYDENKTAEEKEDENRNTSKYALRKTPKKSDSDEPNENKFGRISEKKSAKNEDTSEIVVIDSDENERITKAGKDSSHQEITCPDADQNEDVASDEETAAVEIEKDHQREIVKTPRSDKKKKETPKSDTKQKDNSQVNKSPSLSGMSSKSPEKEGIDTSRSAEKKRKSAEVKTRTNASVKSKTSYTELSPAKSPGKGQDRLLTEKFSVETDSDTDSEINLPVKKSHVQVIISDSETDSEMQTQKKQIVPDHVSPKGTHKSKSFEVNISTSSLEEGEKINMGGPTVDSPITAQDVSSLKILNKNTPKSKTVEEDIAKETEVVPSSQKKLRKEMHEESTADESSEEVTLPNIAAHLKPDGTMPESSPTKSAKTRNQHSPAKKHESTPQKEKILATPTSSPKVVSPGRKRSPKTQDKAEQLDMVSANEVIDLDEEDSFEKSAGEAKQAVKEATPQKMRTRRRSASAAKYGKVEAEKDAAADRPTRRTRTRDISESAVESGSDFEGPSQPKRTRGATKSKDEQVSKSSVPNSAKTTRGRTSLGKAQIESDTDNTVERQSDLLDLDTNTKSQPKRTRGASKSKDVEQVSRSSVQSTRGRTSLGKAQIESDTDNTADQQSDLSDLDTNTKPTRKSVGGRRLPTVKEAGTEQSGESGDVVPATPLSKTSRPRKGSASTSKKVVKKVEELRSTRKRQLSGEMAEAAGLGDSTDSEATAPKQKANTAASKKNPKRLSFPAQSEGSPEKPVVKRYSLRKK